MEIDYEKEENIIEKIFSFVIYSILSVVITFIVIIVLVFLCLIACTNLVYKTIVGIIKNIGPMVIRILINEKKIKQKRNKKKF